ncbi:MAG TPA: DNA gyrase C-terminal beta-propeller domain-containing protein, partial [Levilinea sp.]|nr:DNA gyrase C-terminal beta-propeller domain-containing protein [Levilinea sp.]
LDQVSEKYGDERRTRIAADATEDLSDEDLVADAPVLITITERGYIKRVSPSLYRTRSRGRRGVSGQTIRSEDEVMMIIPARTLHTILFFSDKGKVYSERVYQIPDASRTDKGIPIVNVISLDADERVTAAISVPNFENDGYLTMMTVRGRVKRVGLSDFANVRNSGLIAIGLNTDDQLGWVHLTRGNDDIIIVTQQGQALRYNEKEVRSMGRQAAGVTGIRLRKGDQVAAMEVIEPGGYLLVVTEKGYGKRTMLKEYPVKSRATGGVKTINQNALPVIGLVSTARLVQDGEEVTFISSGGMVLRLAVKSINLSGRATRGVRLMNIAKGDTVASLARTSIEVEQAVEGVDAIDLASGGIGNGDLDSAIGSGNGSGDVADSS